MLRRAHFQLVLTTCLLPVLLAGCGGGNRAIVLTVTDAITHEPIAGAAVKAKATRLFIPDPPYMYLNPVEYDDFSAFTDERGRAEVRAYTERPTSVEITTEGYLRFTGFLEYRGKDLDGLDVWRLDPPPTPVDLHDPLVTVTVTDAGL